ncbi:MAG: Uma2 family endonuclease [Planctomycetes bacterium]|nr:Uma2 family endonuclease [Planctomycetota bacterium]
MSTTARLALGDYDRLIAEGYFESGPMLRERIELIRGELHVMSPIGPSHDELVSTLDEWSHDQAPRDRFRIRVQGAINLPRQTSVPEPDIVWVSRRRYWKIRPGPPDILLLIEVSDTSLAYDRGEKAELYAEAGIADYWIVNVPGRTVEVLREPKDGQYTSRQVFGCGMEVRPLACPETVLNVAELFREE